MIIKSTALGALMVCVVSTASTAQQGGTEAERRACSPDVKRLCSAVLDQGDLAMLSCLKQNRVKISKSCNRVLVSHGQ